MQGYISCKTYMVAAGGKKLKIKIEGKPKTLKLHLFGLKTLKFFTGWEKSNLKGGVGGGDDQNTQYIPLD